VAAPALIELIDRLIAAAKPPVVVDDGSDRPPA
jgi:hypothetical protein